MVAWEEGQRFEVIFMQPMFKMFLSRGYDWRNITKLDYIYSGIVRAWAKFYARQS